jgi:hypothetical protein
LSAAYTATCARTRPSECVPRSSVSVCGRGDVLNRTFLREVAERGVNAVAHVGDLGEISAGSAHSGQDKSTTQT